MNNQIKEHPILTPNPNPTIVTFKWNGKALTGIEGMMISSVLFANDIKVFGHHPLR